MYTAVGVPLTLQDGLGDLPSRFGTDPVVVLAVLGAAIAVVLAAGWLVKWLRRPAGTQLVDVLGAHESVTVLTHPNPDPDAMGSAAAMARLAEHAGTAATIRYPGEIRHQQNRAFRTVLDLDLERINHASEIAEESVVLVDHNEARGFPGAERITPIAVVDHHPGDGTGVSFTDSRPDYGACATILTEYLREVGATMVGPDESPDDYDGGLLVPTAVSTGLLFGILSDTNHLIDGCSQAEFDATAHLYPAIDRDLVNRIANPHVDAETLDAKARAITNRMVDPPYAVSDVGNVGNVDAIPQAAGELVNLETVTAVVVLGDDGDTIHLSGRSRDDRVHMGRILEDIAESIPMASGGGHARMGGGQIDIIHMEGLGPGAGIEREELHRRLFAAMSGTEHEAEPAAIEE